MIVHVVMWKFKDFALGRSKNENVALVKSMLEELPEKIDYIRAMDVKLNVNTKESMYDAMLISKFDTVDDVNNYRVNPYHKEISEFVSQVRLSRACVDYEED